MQKYSTKSWNIDPSSVFAQIDAFTQRCRDLLTVCEGQLQFCRKDRPVDNVGTTVQNSSLAKVSVINSFETTVNVTTSKRARHTLPAFGGAKGDSIRKSLYEIEDAFVKHIQRLKNLKYNILDVNTTAWHEDYTSFKNSVKDLEVMMINVIMMTISI